MRPILLSTLFTFLLTACGYKGALYLPDGNKKDGKFGPIQTGVRLEPNEALQNQDASLPESSEENEKSTQE